MKKIVLIITAAFFTIACNKVSENEFLISGTANGIENGKKIFIEIQGETGSIIKDTGVIENGKFELKGITESIDLGFIRIENEPINLPLILENGEINVTITTDTVQNSKIGGTKNNDLFQSFNEDSKIIIRKKGKFEKANAGRIRAAKTAKDTATVNQIMKEYGTFQDELNKVSVNFIKKNPDAKALWEEALSVERDALLNSLFNRAIEGDSKAAQYLLAARHGMSEKAPEPANERVHITFQLPAALSPDQYSRLVTEQPTTPKGIEND